MSSVPTPPGNSGQRLYGELAYLWPLLSPPDGYAGEARIIHQILTQMLGKASGSAKRSILELGGGGGHTLMHLAEVFDVVAVDLSEPMLAQCRRLNPRVRTHLGDMRRIRLGRTFDAVLAHDAIDYMRTMADARAACATAAAHLNPGGIFLVGPNYTAENFTNYDTAYERNSDGQMEVAYVSYVHRKGVADPSYDLLMTILIRCGHKLRIEQDRHNCGLFSCHEWRSMLASTGFSVQATGNLTDDLAHALFIAIRT